MKTWIHLLVLIAVGLLLCTRSSKADTLYVSSLFGDRIYKITEAGQVSSFVTYDIPFIFPTGLGFDSKANLYNGVDTIYNNEEAINRIDPDGTVYTFVPHTDQLRSGRGLAIDSAGDLYIASQGTDAIVKVTSSGQLSRLASAPPGSFPFGSVAFDKKGNLFAANGYGQSIYRISPTGQVTLFASLPSVPSDLVFDNTGDLLVSLEYPHIIDKITPSGKISVFATGFNDPTGLAFDSKGQLYVGDYGQDIIHDSRIDLVSSTGTVTPFVTGLNSPLFLAFAPVPEPSFLIFYASCSISIFGLLLRRKSVSSRTRQRLPLSQTVG